jgi:hypothetical protein
MSNVPFDVKAIYTSPFDSASFHDTRCHSPTILDESPSLFAEFFLQPVIATSKSKASDNILKIFIYLYNL